jgi:hypothetical protein
MGYFSNLKFGGGTLGLFDNSKLPVGALLDVVQGDFRTDGSFSPGTTTLQATPDDLTKNVNTNKPTDWSPSIIIKPLTVVSFSSF